MIGQDHCRFRKEHERNHSLTKSRPSIWIELFVQVGEWWISGPGKWGGIRLGVGKRCQMLPSREHRAAYLN